MARWTLDPTTPEYYQAGIVSDVQKSLKVHGFDPGPADGMFGVLTRNAVREFQRQHGLTVDGTVSAEVLHLLLEVEGPRPAWDRLVRISNTAIKTFGDSEFAEKWLQLPNPALNNRIPIELAETDAGARQVEVILTRIAHGVYS